jgi:hypothetical protein
MANTPLSVVTNQFGSKEKLVEAVQKLATEALWIDRVSETKGLARVSNAKLLRLHGALEDAKKRFGSRANIISAICDLEKRSKDEGYKTHLAAYPLPRLLDLHDSAQKRSARAAKAPAKAPVKKVARSKKAKVKASAK